MKKKGTMQVFVLVESHKKVKGFAGFRGLELPEAYDILVIEGLKALGYDPSIFK